MSAEVTPLRGKLGGKPGSISDYTVREDASPIHLNDLSAGVGSIDVPAIAAVGHSGSTLLPKQRFTLSDEFAGETTGIVDGLSLDGDFVTISASSGLGALVADKVTPAMNDTLYGVVTSIMTLAQVGTPIGVISSGDPEADSALLDQNVCIPANSGDTWTLLKRLSAIYNFDISIVGDFIYIRPKRKRTISSARDASERITFDGGSQVRDITVHYYNNVWSIDKPVYPRKDVSIVNMSIISVDPSESVTTNYPVDMWISTIDQPTMANTVPVDYQPGADGIYSVIDTENNQVPPSVWQNAGGSLSVAIGADGRSIDVTVVGMSTNENAPYRIAASSDDKEYQYASLYVSATGIAFEDKTITVRSAANEADLPTDSTVEIDDLAVTTREQAYAQAILIAIDGSGTAQYVDVDASYVNHQGEMGTSPGVTFDEATTAEGWEDLTFTDYFNAADPTDVLTFSEWGDAIEAENAPVGERQSFGNVAGARTRIGDALYRVTSASMGPGSIGWQGAEDTLFQDWSDVYEPEDLTFDQYGDIWADYSFDEMGRQPLYIQ